MVNFLTYFKKFNPNMYALTVSVLLAMWYNGISGLINYLFPERGFYLGLALLVIPLAIFLTDDGNLDEIYQPVDDQYPSISSVQSDTTAVGATSAAQATAAASRSQAASRTASRARTASQSGMAARRRSPNYM